VGHSLGDYSLTLPILDRATDLPESGGLQSHATDFGSHDPLTCVWGGLQSGGLRETVVQSHATDFGPCDPLTSVWGATVSSYRFWIARAAYLSPGGYSLTRPILIARPTYVSLGGYSLEASLRGYSLTLPISDHATHLPECGALQSGRLQSQVLQSQVTGIARPIYLSLGGYSLMLSILGRVAHLPESGGVQSGELLSHAFDFRSRYPIT